MEPDIIMHHYVSMVVQDLPKNDGFQKDKQLYKNQNMKTLPQCYNYSYIQLWKKLAVWKCGS